MKEIRISPAAEDALADILEYSIDQWGLAGAELYKDQLLERVRSVARGELPHPRPCSVLVQGERAGTGLCYCREGRHFIILRESNARIDIVDFLHESRDLDRLIDGLGGMP